jgi:hypothetical protein
VAWLFYLIVYDLISEAWFKVGSVKWYSQWVTRLFFIADFVMR